MPSHIPTLYIFLTGTQVQSAITDGTQAVNAALAKGRLTSDEAKTLSSQVISNFRTFYFAMFYQLDVLTCLIPLFRGEPQGDGGGSDGGGDGGSGGVFEKWWFMGVWVVGCGG
jgi:hypothetical protein